MKIGEIARATGFSTKAIRYYEEIGVLPEPARAPNGYREYGPTTVERLEFVRDAQATGLSLTEIASILDERDRGHSTCEHVATLLARHLAELDERIDALQRTRKRLARMAARAEAVDPAECTDPIRCQTIMPADEPLEEVSELHSPLRHGHRH